MKKRFIKKTAALLVCCWLTCLAATAQTKEIKQLAEVSEALRNAMVDPTKEKLEALVMDSLTYGHSGGHIDDKKEFVDKLTIGNSDFVSIDITDQTIQYYKNTGIVRHTLTAVTNDNKKPGTVKLKVLLVWVKAHGQWKLLSRQAVKAS